MKFFLKEAIFFNRAPFNKLDLHFDENEIAVLSAVNGRGKTTILSHIVDAFHEIARTHFAGAYEGKENKYYRVSSNIEKLDVAKPSIVYLRFCTSDGQLIDQLNIRGQCTEEEYNSAVILEGKIPYAQITSDLTTNNAAKRVSANVDKKIAETIFSNNILTYFPSYRFEQPGYLNDPYKIRMEFALATEFAGRLTNPLEIITGLPQLANWIMDVVLDNGVNNDAHSQRVLQNLAKLLTLTLISKGYGNLRFGIGQRGLGGARIQVLTNAERGVTIYPSLFSISSGEAAMLSLFGELIHQADNIKRFESLEAISGIVLIDEVDKHLHIKLQKEILPQLFKVFPNVQFIISSHSPFLSMGLAEVLMERSKIIDLETFGISKDPTTNELYSEVYQLMLGESDKFKDLYVSLQEKMTRGELPLVITEGKTDVQHLKKAKEKLNINCDVEYFEIDGSWGDSKLKILLEQLSKVPQRRKIIGIFDRDTPTIVADIEAGGQIFKHYGNNVHAFCIPTPVGRERYSNISIEFYYNEADLKKEKNGKRLYFDNEVEFRQSASAKAKRTLKKLDAISADDEHTKKIIDENIGDLDWIHSKAAFAALIENDDEFIADFDFSSFQIIFSRIDEILNHA